MFTSLPFDNSKLRYSLLSNVTCARLQDVPDMLRKMADFVEEDIRQKKSMDGQSSSYSDYAEDNHFNYHFFKATEKEIAGIVRGGIRAATAENTLKFENKRNRY